MTLSEEATVRRLVDAILDEWPTVHVRFGDGDVFFATATGPKLTADGEEWTPELGARLRTAWHHLALAPYLLVGDVMTYDVSDGCDAQWRELVWEAEELRSEPLPLVHIEALRCSREHALPFYKAVAESRLPKVFVGPERLAGAARMLGADHLQIPLGTSHEVVTEVVEEINLTQRYNMALFAAGRGGKIMQADLALSRPGLIQFDIGSGLDLLFDGVRRGTDSHMGPREIEALRRSWKEAGLDV